MSVKFVQGDLLDATEDILVHQVNCMGIMGSGLARQIAEKWPEVYAWYKNRVHDYDSIKERHALLGQTQWCRADNKWIVNIFGQYDFGRQRDKTYTDYKALKNGLTSISIQASVYRMSVAIPYGIGCGLGGGDWEGVVLPMILDIFGDEDVDAKIYQRKYT